jgi:hypothetical protein
LVWCEMTYNGFTNHGFNYAMRFALCFSVGHGHVFKEHGWIRLLQGKINGRIQLRAVPRQQKILELG